MEFELCTPETLTDKDRAEIQRLFRQLNPDLVTQDPATVLGQPNPPTLLLCRENGQLLGMATLCVYTAISGIKAWVEDVVVDTPARGRGLGRQLMERLLEVARQRGATEVLLFTGHHRTAALQLYLSMGFTRKQSHLLRLVL